MNSHFRHDIISTILNTISDGIIICNDNGETLFENKSAKSINKLTPIDWKDLIKKNHNKIPITITENDNGLHLEITINKLKISANENYTVLIIANRSIYQELKKVENQKTLIWAKAAHEIRTPMHNILSYAQLGPQTIKNESLEKTLMFFERITESGNMLMDFLNNLIGLSRLEELNKPQQFEKVDLLKIIERNIIEFEDILKKKNISIKVNYPKFSVNIPANEFQIAQVFRNILSNAIKFSDPNKECSISFKNKTILTNKKNIPAIQVEIKDQGPGIPIEDREVIFEKFFQSNNCSQKDGAGLGLTICREITAKHNGKIWVTPNPDCKGSIFKILLPK